MKKYTWYAGIIIVVAWMVAIISLLGTCVFLDNERVQKASEITTTESARSAESLWNTGVQPRIDICVTTIVFARTVML